MVRTVDRDARRRAVLASTINRYIKNAVPVSSEETAREFELSPATIRNIFSELEEAGYLTHPHTSAGRVPTEKGYRYYVDFLNLQLDILD
ncbi:MAG: DeoR family transcriptional regulator, partial [Deltaproteobacteria bacterium]